MTSKGNFTFIDIFIIITILFIIFFYWLRMAPQNVGYFNYKHQLEMLERWNYLDKVWYQIYKNEGIYPFFILDPTDVC